MTTRLTDEFHAERFTCVNAAGRRIAGLVCTPRAGEPRGHVVLPPGYQQRIHHFSVLSRYLVRHGYATVRFDFTNHIGLSEGEIVDLTMSSMAADIAAVVATCRRLPGPQLVAATSLGARATIRALAESPPPRPVAGVVLVLPVVDVEYTTTRVIGRNVIDRWRTGEVRDESVRDRVLDYDVSFGFARDALENRFDGPLQTGSELAAILAPVTAIAAERDDWIDHRDVERAMAFAAPAARHTIVMEATSHDLSHNPPVVRLLVEQILGAFAAAIGAPSEVAHLEFDEIVATIAQERAWKREAYTSLPEHRSLATAPLKEVAR